MAGFPFLSKLPVDTDAVIPHTCHKVAVIRDPHFNLRCFGVLPDVGKRFLNDERHLKLLLLGEVRAVTGELHLGADA